MFSSDRIFSTARVLAGDFWAGLPARFSAIDVGGFSVVGSGFKVARLRIKEKTHSPLCVWVSNDVFKNVFRCLRSARRRLPGLVYWAFARSGRFISTSGNVSLAPVERLTSTSKTYH
jgi:hypothetical protein